MYKISFDFPNLPKGAEIDITGLTGIFQNGKSYIIDDVQAEGYRAAGLHPVVVEGPAESDAPIEWKQGPTLLEAFKDHAHVKVEVYTKPKEGDK